MADKSNSNTADSNNLDQIVATAEASLFGFIFSSAEAPKWFDTLMQHAGNYLFTAALIFRITTFIRSVVRYIKASNKNINEKASLVWNTWQLAAIGAAIVGLLVAAAAFTLVTPILFVAALATDTLRNFGILAWDALQLGFLHYKKVRKKLNNQLTEQRLDDQLTEQKYKIYKEKYWDNIKQIFPHPIIGVFATVGAAIIFLFPHIAVGGLAAFASAVIVIGVIKISVSGLAGIVAAAAILSPIVGKGIAALAKRAVISFFAFINKIRKTNNPKKEEQKPLTQSADISGKKSKMPALKYTISTEEELNIAIKHQINFKAYTQQSAFRELIIKNIDDQKFALRALSRLVQDKIKALDQQINNAGKISFWMRRKLELNQESTRVAKRTALELLSNLTNKKIKELQASKKEKIDKHLEVHESLLKDEYGSVITTLSGMVAFIKRTDHKVSESFLLGESDTDNVLKAALEYEAKFESSAEKNSAERQSVMTLSK